MSANKPEETPANVTTDAESQEYGAEQGQNIEGRDTGSSAPDASAEQSDEADAERGDGTGARAGAYS
ncbi:MAG TPA: hypothetical protein VHU19_13815 [Pyrinomonadaceae bacterium]|jgi:hypothetical protein|nr:hypothetical protein [Pyrinomonadaceae bacterium]